MVADWQTKPGKWSFLAVLAKGFAWGLAGPSAFRPIHPEQKW